MARLMTNKQLQGTTLLWTQNVAFVSVIYLMSPNLSIRKEGKCSLFMFSMPAHDVINCYPSPYNDLFSTLKSFHLFSFLLMKTNPHLLLFLPTLTAFFPVLLYIL